MASVMNKKRILLVMMSLLLTALSVRAQDEAVAVLTHEGSSKVFSGREALKAAYAEAAHGDLITLSSGQFEAATPIEKAITIRGAGLGVDTIYGTQPTVIYNDFVLDIPSDVEGSHFTLEGIFHNGTISYSHVQKDLEFIKCRLGALTRAQYEVLGGEKEYGSVVGMKIMQCKITERLYCGVNSTMNIYNSFVTYPVTVDNETSNMTFANCVLISSYTTTIRGSYLRNCISGPTVFYGGNTTVTNCLLNTSSLPAKDKNTYTTFKAFSAVFKTFTSNYTELENFELRDDVKSVYVDANGSEIGMYGGVLPYSPRLAGPHLSLFNVNTRTTSDGKLRVRLQVESTLE